MTAIVIAASVLCRLPSFTRINHFHSCYAFKVSITPDMFV